MKPQAIITGSALLAAVAAAVATAQPIPDRDGLAALETIERTLGNLIVRTEPSVVAVLRSEPRRTPDPAQTPTDTFGEFRTVDPPAPAASVVGAGVIIDRDGLVLTHYLAVRDGDEHSVVTLDGKRYAATIRGADPRSGLAVLRVEPSNPERTADAGPGSFPALRLGDAATLRKGQFVVVIGNPYAIVSDGQPTTSWGMVTNLARKAPAGTNFNDAPGPNNDHRTTLHHLGTLIQTDARLGWNAAGGALVNLRGELIGLTTTAATIAGHEQPAGYAIPINALMRRAIDALKQGREVEYGMLGVGFGHPIAGAAPDRRPQLAVVQVFPGGPAARAGLQIGDVIKQVAEQPVKDVDAVQLAISALPPETTTQVEYERNGLPATATVTLAKLGIAGKTIATVRPKFWRGIRVDYASALDAAQLMQAESSGAYDAAGCVLVVEVEPDSEAWQAGLRPGMFVSHVGDMRVATPAEFRRAAANLTGEELDIRITQPPPPRDSGDPRILP